MGWGRATETELMQNLVEGYTELGCSKWKSGNGFLRPNFEPEPSPVNYPGVDAPDHQFEDFRNRDLSPVSSY